LQLVLIGLITEQIFYNTGESQSKNCSYSNQKQTEIFSFSGDRCRNKKKKTNKQEEKRKEDSQLNVN
jgi:hypothetical protein